MGRFLAGLYLAGAVATFVYLTAFDGYTYTAWNWLIALPVNAALSAMWPIYWAALRPLFG